MCRLEAMDEVVGGHEVGAMLPNLIMAVLMEVFGGGVFDRALYPFDLTVLLRMVRLRKAVLDVEVGAGALIRSGGGTVPSRRVSTGRHFAQTPHSGRPH